MRSRERCYIALIILMFIATGCVDIPSEFTINHEIDTGRDLQNLVDEALEDLHEAERIAGEEVRETIREAIYELEGFSVEIIEIFGDQLDRTINTLDQALQDKLLWVQIYTEEVHGYALSIIHATGEEARETIQEATLGMRRTIIETELAAQRTTLVATQNAMYLVDTVAERTLSIGGLISGLLLMFICTFGWGRLIYQRRMPSTDFQRMLALGLMAVSFFFSFLPFSMLIPPVRAYALAQVGRASLVGESESVVAGGLEVPRGVPRVYEFIPDYLTVPIANPDEQKLIIEGANLMAMGIPVITYGGIDCPVTGYTEDRISVDISSASDNPGLSGSVEVQFGTEADAVQYAVPVYQATPEPTVEELPILELKPIIIDPQLRPTFATVPEVAGLSEVEAVNTLTSQGFGVEEILYESSEAIGSGLAIRTDPLAGTSLGISSEETQHIKLYISRGPICEVFTEDDTDTQLITETYHPNNTIGDSEFGGNGPDVVVRVSVFVEGNALKAKIYMKARETRNDHSTAEGFTILTLFEPEAGYAIRKVVGATVTEISYRDTGHAADDFTRPLSEPVVSLSVIGDTSGKDIGQRDGDTGVTVAFREIPVELIKTEECASSEVEVEFRQIDFENVDSRACSAVLYLNAGGQSDTWSFQVNPHQMTYYINKSLRQILREDEALSITVQGVYAINCSGIPVYAANLGVFQRTFMAMDDWGEGEYVGKVSAPNEFSIHFAVNSNETP